MSGAGLAKGSLEPAPGLAMCGMAELPGGPEEAIEADTDGRD